VEAKAAECGSLANGVGGVQSGGAAAEYRADGGTAGRLSELEERAAAEGVLRGEKQTVSNLFIDWNNTVRFGREYGAMGKDGEWQSQTREW
jgi:hypothetical protein